MVSDALPPIRRERVFEVLGEQRAHGRVVELAFAHGGFLVDAGKRGSDPVAPLVARLAFPDGWRVVLTLPPWRPGLHAEEERQAFSHLRASARRDSERTRWRWDGIPWQ